MRRADRATIREPEVARSFLEVFALGFGLLAFTGPRDVALVE